MRTSCCPSFISFPLHGKTSELSPGHCQFSPPESLPVNWTAQQHCKLHRVAHAPLWLLPQPLKISAVHSLGRQHRKPARGCCSHPPPQQVASTTRLLSRSVRRPPALCQAACEGGSIFSWVPPRPVARKRSAGRTPWNAAGAWQPSLSADIFTVGSCQNLFADQ